ncbi:MAG: cupin domain-containing protein [Fimbriimonadaceae bacterium]|nr:cupin domain-containing protein [Fimbriimonadaceae bacterium]
MNHRYVADLLNEITIPEHGITSRALYSDEHTRAVIFGFDQGEELSEHTASMDAILHVLQGEATLTLGGETREAKAGSWVHMEANLPHSVVAKTPLVILLTLLKTTKS